ncbi:hypothetical protein ACP70R_043045 [Stipagrostis hirtigluma subsp. patula]
MVRKRSRGRQRQHLYILFDDWSLGFSVCKVDVSSATDSEGTVLPSPAIFRMEAEHEFPHYFAAAFGSKIIPMPVRRRILGTASLMPCDAEKITVYDVHKRGLTGYGPPPKVDPVNPICIPIGNRLFVLSSDSFQVLNPPSVDDPKGQRWKGSWRKLPLQPFCDHPITSYAVHPDGRTIFVSAENLATSTFATYTFNTAKSRSKWKKQGDWKLPFTGRAHFDSNLEAWVGICGDLNSYRNICACDVVSVQPDECLALDCKMSKDELFSKGPGDFPANLVVTGNKFCLIECVCLLGDGTEIPYDPPYVCGRPHFRMVTFSLEYDKNGDLTTANSHRVRYCKVPKAAECSMMEPMAFWM